MVKLFKILACFVLATSLSALVEVGVTIDSEKAGEGEPIEGIITVRRPDGESIDEGSFVIKDRSLDVEFLHDSVHSSVMIINGSRSEHKYIVSSYRFFLSGQREGQYVLPSVSVQVRGKEYYSDPTAYTVYSSEVDPKFHLVAKVRGPQPLYPGQRVELVYTLSSWMPVEVTSETLPFLEAKGFRKVGDKRVKFDTKGRVIVQEIVQEVEAIDPGEYTFGSGVIEGLPYRQDFFGRRAYEKKRLRAETHPMTLTVAPFPTDAPEAFSGAIGDYTLSTRLLSPETLTVGDRIRLEITLEGKGSSSTLRLPDLAELEAFHSFRLSDLPPDVEEFAQGRRFTVEMRPMSAELTEIPPIAFASFDPKSGDYHFSQSEGIPIGVEMLATASSPPPLQPVQRKVSQEVPHQQTNWRELYEQPLTLDIASCYALGPEDLKRDERRWSLLWLFPLSGAALMFQVVLKKQRGKRRHRRVKSCELFKVATKRIRSGDPRGYKGLEHALFLALKEKGVVVSIPSVATLPKTGVGGEVRTLLEKMELARYATVEHMDDEEVIRQAEKILEELS